MVVLESNQNCLEGWLRNPQTGSACPKHRKPVRVLDERRLSSPSLEPGAGQLKLNSRTPRARKGDRSYSSDLRDERSYSTCIRAPGWAVELLTFLDWLEIMVSLR